jgi:hypothetical protein
VSLNAGSTGAGSIPAGTIGKSTVRSVAAEAGLRHAEIACVHRRNVIACPAGAKLLVHGKGGKLRIVSCCADAARTLKRREHRAVHRHIPGKTRDAMRPRWPRAKNNVHSKPFAEILYGVTYPANADVYEHGIVVLDGEQPPGGLAIVATTRLPIYSECSSSSAPRQFQCEWRLLLDQRDRPDRRQR